MAEIDFERRLERLFADAPELPDAGGFAERVERRLNVGWATRRWLIGAAGVVGGVVGVSQLMLANVLGRMESLSEDSERVLAGLNRAVPQLEWFATAPVGAVVWPAVGLAIVATGFVLSRVIEEI